MNGDMDNRPDPDLLLKEIKQSEHMKQRGKLKIFFGYAAGVGKTYTMLEDAHTAIKQGIDVVVGYIEPHTRPETMDRLKGLEILPPLEVAYKGITLREFNLDVALARKPELILVDELAHSNAEGLRHLKRYSDIEELLDAGIDVYTTVNVQHIESLNDIVASITHVVVKERVPDYIFDEAYQVELIDIEPGELLHRFSDGKIYKENQAKTAVKNFFTDDNLIALREISLRHTADRVNRERESFHNINGGKNNYNISEHVLVCLSSSPANSTVIRAAARMASAFHAEFTAIYVETPEMKKFTEARKKSLKENIKLAEELGAKVTITYSDDPPYQIAEFARISGITKVIVGRSKGKGVLSTYIFKKYNFVDWIIHLAPEVEIFVIPDEVRREISKSKSLNSKFNISMKDTTKLILIIMAALLIGWAFIILLHNNTNLSGREEHLVTFMAMLLTAITTGVLTGRLKGQAAASAVNAYRTNILLETNNYLQGAYDLQEIAIASQRQVYKILRKPVVMYLTWRDAITNVYSFASEEGESLDDSYTDADEQAVVSWVIKNKKRAGVGTGTLPGAKACYLPISAHGKVMGVVGVILEPEEQIDNSEKSLLAAVLGQISFAIERQREKEGY